MEYVFGKLESFACAFLRKRGKIIKNIFVLEGEFHKLFVKNFCKMPVYCEPFFSMLKFSPPRSPSLISYELLQNWLVAGDYCYSVK